MDCSSIDFAKLPALIDNMMKATAANVAARGELIHEYPYFQAFTLLHDLCVNKLQLQKAFANRDMAYIAALLNADVPSIRKSSKDAPAPFMFVMPIAIAVLNILVAGACWSEVSRSKMCAFLAQRSIELETLWDGIVEEGRLKRLLSRPEYVGVDFEAYAREIKTIFDKVQFAHEELQTPLNILFGGRRKPRTRTRSRSRSRRRVKKSRSRSRK